MPTTQGSTLFCSCEVTLNTQVPPKKTTSKDLHKHLCSTFHSVLNVLTLLNTPPQKIPKRDYIPVRMRSSSAHAQCWAVSSGRAGAVGVCVVTQFESSV